MSICFWCLVSKTMILVVLLGQLFFGLLAYIPKWKAHWWQKFPEDFFLIFVVFGEKLLCNKQCQEKILPPQSCIYGKPRVVLLPFFANSKSGNMRNSYISRVADFLLWRLMSWVDIGYDLFVTCVVFKGRLLVRLLPLIDHPKACVCPVSRDLS